MLLIVMISHSFWRRVKSWWADRLKRRFGDLSEEQRVLLQRVFDGESREFYFRSELSSRRWFEELVTWNYVEPLTLGMGGRVQRRRLTEQGWHELKRKFNR